MTPRMLRQLWSLIETTQAHVLLDLDDKSLVQWLLRQLQDGRSLNPEEDSVMNDYINSRLPLIRDLAQHRMVPNH
ncbi:MAG TPA: hypothetical protein IGS53_04465 [Leptolyngbyaceae cyanobacterium M33_DOE_097]|uniref:Uncharacterized protein n=1 Tax=Oscillatoriales cyanobacterium SpSt-418 TaxID=2282169 RepID=A0A7C3KJM3_9CYAN|nr:hypothetical protein [Leptolyngbyaceae cyanobacterium M33_DOE_097]